MRKANSLWKTSEHWKARAASAIGHAEYEGRPAVRHRRIKGLEADLRKYKKGTAEADAFLKLWHREGLTREQALQVASYDHVHLAPRPGETWGRSIWDALKDEAFTVAEAVATVERVHASGNARRARWIGHLENRLAYERALLEEVGGIAVTAAKWDLQVGGRISYRFGTAIVVRVNRKDGAVTSVSVPSGSSWTTKVSVEDIKSYEPPAEGDGAKVKAASALGPVINRPGEGFVEMTSERWKEYTKARRSPCLGRVAATGTHSAFRTREVCRGGQFTEVFLTDAKRADPPAREVPTAPASSPESLDEHVSVEELEGAES